MIETENPVASEGMPLTLYKEQALLHRMNTSFSPQQDGIFIDWLESLTEVPAIIPTSAQLAAVAARTYIEDVRVPERAFNSYLEWKGVHKTQRGEYRNQELVGYSRIAFDRLYGINGNGGELSRLRRDYGEEAEAMISVKRRAEQDVVDFKKRLLLKAGSLGVADRISIGLQVSKELLSLTGEQRERLLRLVGYSSEEVKEIIIRGAISGPLFLSMYLAEDKIPDILGLSTGVISPLLDNNLANPKTAVIAVGSAFVYYGTQALKIEQCLRFLKDKRVKAIPSPSAVISYHLYEKILADRPTSIDWATRIGYVANPFELSKEVWWATLPASPSVFLAGNLAAIGINLLQLGVYEVSRRLQLLRYRDQVDEGKTTSNFGKVK